MDSIKEKVAALSKIDIFKDAREENLFVGRPFYIDYDKAFLLVADAWKMNVSGIPQGTFLLSFYENEEDVSECLLLRALKPAKLPTDNDIISSMIEYYKDNLKTTGAGNQLDDFTRYQFGFSGLECRVLGTFYKNSVGAVAFGADVENFYSAHNYSTYKPMGNVLKEIVNMKDSDEMSGLVNDISIGKVRYSSSSRFHENIEEVPVYVNSKDFMGKRTALFGMTRTGKSNTVKKIIEATFELSSSAKLTLGKTKEGADELLEPFSDNGIPKYPVGQIIFDINGEYANANLQDKGTAIYELFKDKVSRYSVLEKEGFIVLKVNFYNEVLGGFDIIVSGLFDDNADYLSSFKSIDMNKPDATDMQATTRYDRKKAAYLCCLYKAGFEPSKNFKVKFKGNKELNLLVQKDGKIDPSTGISLEEATNWFETIWSQHNNKFFSDYKAKKGYDWADEDLKALLVLLSRKKTPTGSATISGFRKLNKMRSLHTNTSEVPFEKAIIDSLRSGEIVIVDLSQGDPSVQRLYSERICNKLFSNAMGKFIDNSPNNFIQFYFEEAHNLFPKKDDKDLSQIYNRIAKEGAKLNLGLIYATQEVSSISSNILKNTQNWFIAHLNNDDEVKELKKYYDFSDFADSLIRFSATSDKGFVRMKTYSNPFVVPVQVDRFLEKKDK